jgi:hypothetical protein
MIYLRNPQRRFATSRPLLRLDGTKQLKTNSFLPRTGHVCSTAATATKANALMFKDFV